MDVGQVVSEARDAIEDVGEDGNVRRLLELHVEVALVLHALHHDSTQWLQGGGQWNRC